MVPANIFTGRNFDYRTTPIPVLATSQWDAINAVNRNKVAVLEYLHEKKVQTGRSIRYLIPHRVPASENVVFMNTYYVRSEKMECEHYNVLCPDGKFHRVNFKTYKDGSYSLRVFN